MSTGISRTPQNGGSGTGASVRAAERTESSVRSTGAGSLLAVLAQLACAVAHLGDQALALLGVDEPVHHREALEGVLAVEDAGPVGVVGLSGPSG